MPGRGEQPVVVGGRRGVILDPIESAVRLDRFGMIAFGPKVPEGLRGTIRDELGGRIIEGVQVEPYGEGPIAWDALTREAAGPVVCEARANPALFRLYRSPDQVDHDRFEPIDARFTIIGTGPAWRVFVETLAELAEIASQTDEADTDEAWDEILDRLEGRSSSPSAAAIGER